MANKQRTFTFPITPDFAEDWKKFQEVAKGENRSASYLVRDVLKKYLEAVKA